MSGAAARTGNLREKREVNILENTIGQFHGNVRSSTKRKKRRNLGCSIISMLNIEGML